MNDNIAIAEEKQPTFNFQTTPIWKFVCLSIVSLGFYHIIWSYNLWKTLKDNTNYKVSPFWRGLLINLTNFFLFPIINKHLEKYGEKIFPPFLFASIYILLSYASHKLPDPYWLIGFANIYILANIQARINKVNSSNFADAPQNVWTKTNTAWTVFFVIILILIIILLFIPE